MSRGESFSRFNASACSFLEADVGAVEGDVCSVGPCGDDAVYRVPWPQFGGDLAYCPYHLARYRSDYSKEFHRVQQHVDHDLSALATRGDRFLSLADVPSNIRGGRYRRVGLTELGYALFEQVQPDEDGLVTYVLVEWQLERTPEGGRDVVIQLLRDRIEELEANGERDLPGHDAEELRQLGREAYQSVAPKPDAVILGPDGEPTGRSEGRTAAQKLAAMADGGEEE